VGRRPGRPLPSQKPTGNEETLVLPWVSGRAGFPPRGPNVAKPGTQHTTPSLSVPYTVFGVSVSAGAPDKIAVTLTKHIYFEARIRKRTRKPGLDVDTSPPRPGMHTRGLVGIVMFCGGRGALSWWRGSVAVLPQALQRLKLLRHVVANRLCVLVACVVWRVLTRTTRWTGFASSWASHIRRFLPLGRLPPRCRCLRRFRRRLLPRCLRLCHLRSTMQRLWPLKTTRTWRCGSGS
jgi:hypothetical protein